MNEGKIKDIKEIVLIHDQIGHTTYLNISHRFFLWKEKVIDNFFTTGQMLK